MDPQRIIRRPLITEKATRMKEATNTVCFEVAPNANKIEIARAVTALFGVKVAAVRVANRKASGSGWQIHRPAQDEEGYVRLRGREPSVLRGG